MWMEDVFYLTSLCKKKCNLSDYKNLDPSYMGKDTKLYYCPCSFGKAMELRQKAGIGKKNKDEYFTVKSLRQEYRWRTIFQEKFVPIGIKSWGHHYYMERLKDRIWTCLTIWG